MAYTKIMVIHNRLDKCLDYAQDKEKTALSLAEAIDYALNRDKTEQACFETGLNCDVEAAWRDMLATKRRWGKVQRKRQGYHIIQSFAPGEVTPEEAHAVGVEFAQRLFGERYEAIVTTHLNKAHLHNHVVVNSVSMLDGAMYRDTFQDYYGGDGVGIRGTSDATCQAHGLSVIEPDPESPDRRRSRPEWEGKTTIRDTVRHDIDAALGRAYTLQSLLQELRRMGYQVQAGNRKHISIRPPGGAGNIRLDSLGDGYTEADLKARLEAIRTGQRPPGPPPPASPWRSPGRTHNSRPDDRRRRENPALRSGKTTEKPEHRPVPHRSRYSRGCPDCSGRRRPPAPQSGGRAPPLLKGPAQDRGSRFHSTGPNCTGRGHSPAPPPGGAAPGLFSRPSACRFHQNSTG